MGRTVTVEYISTYMAPQARQANGPRVSRRRQPARSRTWRSSTGVSCRSSPVPARTTTRTATSAPARRWWTASIRRWRRAPRGGARSSSSTSTNGEDSSTTSHHRWRRFLRPTRRRETPMAGSASARPPCSSHPSRSGRIRPTSCTTTRPCCGWSSGAGAWTPSPYATRRPTTWPM